MCMLKSAALITGRRLFETRRLLEEIRCGTKYSRMDQVNLWETTLKKFHLVHS